MALTFKHPGVYVDEISTIPSSIAQVETAVPAFVGYTAKREKNGVAFDINIPQRITSLLEYEMYFGSGFPETLEVIIDEPDLGSQVPKVTISPATALSGYVLYYHVKMFYENGGGTCYVTSVGTYNAGAPNIDKTELKNGLIACEKEDEVTLLAVPEATALTAAAETKELYDAMLSQCSKLQDRFAILDVIQPNTPATLFQVADAFRNDYVSADNLKYGAAYYPRIQSSVVYNRVVDEMILIAEDNRGGDNLGIYKPVGDVKKPITDIIKASAQTAVASTAKITINADTIDSQSISIAGISLVFGTEGVSIASSNTTTAKNLKDAINNNDDLKTIIVADSSGKVVTITALKAGISGNAIPIVYDPKGGAVSISLDGNFLQGGFDAVNFPLFYQIKKALDGYTVALYPSGMVTGVMARVDQERGVWKAPANVSIRTVDKPLQNISDDEQDYLNVDPTSGKSINVIRKFAGKGTLVWGARTLAGNDNEWRYVPVRRLFIMVEESVKKATEFVVFEPNDAKTWMRVKTMCENFLNQLWRQGALAGAKPEHAYFVNVGLGITMSSIDILEGRLIVEIGMAAVRPAEFIILKFSHLLAKS
ncbi:phage tail sheath family protein [Pedobacter sandarakinus]|uniref:phage tail sheath family protein n=1 Tax=Pedobacter sandarakinus TaxID=353156 RepID=UPI0022462B3A|nr:phage tail sheath C-terminal domain-containing protein [Pedobacter sandarakinus]MCX2574546.1 phage tail sheath subtilisin-like domain-containing protein [Pedobacter sandarakinus]